MANRPEIYIESETDPKIWFQSLIGDSCIVQCFFCTGFKLRVTSTFNQTLWKIDLKVKIGSCQYN